MEETTTPEMPAQPPSADIPPKPVKKRDLSFARAKREAIPIVAYKHKDELQQVIETLLGHKIENFHLDELRGDTLTLRHKKNISTAQQIRHGAEEMLKLSHKDEYQDYIAKMTVKVQTERAKEYARENQPPASS